MREKKLLQKILAGSRNTSFSDFVLLIRAFGFTLARTSGSHHIYTHPEVDELINVQSVGGKAKPYQIRQLLDLVEKYNLELRDKK